MLNVRRLEVLDALARLGSFSKAADALDYTQSAVSQHIAALERETGATLVERGIRPVALTDAGQQLLEDVLPALQHLARAEARLQELTQLRAGRVRVGAFPSAHASVVPKAFAAFRRSHPQVEVVLEEVEPSDAVPMLRAGRLDVAVVYTVHGRPDAFAPPIALQLAGDDPLVLAVPPDHRLARRRAVGIAELAGESWIAPKRPNDFREFFDAVCSGAGFAPRIAAETAEPDAGLALTQAGIGVMLTPALALVRDPTP